MSGFYLCDTEILGLSHSAVKIYSFLRMVNNSVTHESFYKRSNIAAHCHISESTVVRSVRELRGRGLLKVDTRFLPNGRQTSNSYTLIDNPQLSFRFHKPQNHVFEDGMERMSCSAGRQQKDVTAPIRQFRCNATALQNDLSPSALKVYSYLSLRAGKGGKTMPAKKEIAANCGISISSVSRAIVALNAAGLIEVRRQTRMETCGNNGNSVNLYVMMRPDHKRKVSRVLRNFLFPCPPDSFPKECFLPFSDILPHVTGDTARTISRMKLKQRKEYSYSTFAMRNQHAGKDRCNSECNSPQCDCGEFLFPCFQNIRQGVTRMNSIVGLPVIVSEKYRIVINSSFRSALHIPVTGRVRLLIGKDCLQIFPDSDSVSTALKKNISAGRFNLPMDWVHKNRVKIGEHVFLIAASDCIFVRPSVCQSNLGQKDVLQ